MPNSMHCTILHDVYKDGKQNRPHIGCYDYLNKMRNFQLLFKDLTGTSVACFRDCSIVITVRRGVLCAAHLTCFMSTFISQSLAWHHALLLVFSSWNIIHLLNLNGIDRHRTRTWVDTHHSLYNRVYGRIFIYYEDMLLKLRVLNKINTERCRFETAGRQMFVLSFFPRIIYVIYIGFVMRK